MAKALASIFGPVLGYYGYKSFIKRDVSEGENIKKQYFGKLQTGEQPSLFTLSNDQMSITVTNYGATLTSVVVPDKNNIKNDVVLGFSHLSQYVESQENFGNIVGRYGNRIANGKFTLGDWDYQLECNNAPAGIPCHLHGGTFQFGKKYWEHTVLKSNEDEPGIQFTYLSKDGEAGYPGNLEINVTYWLLKNNSIKIDYTAKTDKATVLNPTNHSYFNLKGHGQADILDHYLKIFSNKIVEVNQGLIPTGKFLDVEGSPFDFRKFKMIGQQINDNSNQQIKYGTGYDHSFVIDQQANLENKYDGPRMFKAAEVRELSSGRKLEVFTSEPAVQLYTGNFLGKQSVGKNNTQYANRGGFCLETQHYPDSPNHPEFPSTILYPKNTFKSSTIYKFGIIE